MHTTRDVSKNILLSVRKARGLLFAQISPDMLKIQFFPAVRRGAEREVLTNQLSILQKRAM